MTALRIVEEKPLKPGLAGTEQLVADITREIRRALTKPGERERTRDFALRVLANARPQDTTAEIQAIWDYLTRRSAPPYRRNPVDQQLIAPPYLFDRLKGVDCKQYTITAGALLEAAGHPTRVKVIDQRPQHGRNADYHHVYLEVFDADRGEWVVFDPVAKSWRNPSANVGTELPYEAARIFPMSSLSGAVDCGCGGMSKLAGGLGDPVTVGVGAAAVAALKTAALDTLLGWFSEGMLTVAKGWLERGACEAGFLWGDGDNLCTPQEVSSFVVDYYTEKWGMPPTERALKLTMQPVSSALGGTRAPQKPSTLRGRVDRYPPTAAERASFEALNPPPPGGQPGQPGKGGGPHAMVSQRSTLETVAIGAGIAAGVGVVVYVAVKLAKPKPKKRRRRRRAKAAA